MTFGRVNLLAEEAKVSARLLERLETVECAGKQVHDDNVVDRPCWCTASAPSSP